MNVNLNQFCRAGEPRTQTKAPSIRGRLAKRIRGLFWTGVLLAGASPWAGAQSSFISATPQTPVTLGQPLNITVVVKNTSTLFAWTPGNLGASWRIKLDSPSWSAGWSSLRLDSTDDVKKNTTATLIMTVGAADLPQAAGSYTIRVNTYYNNMGLSLDPMTGSPKTVSFTVTSANHAPVLSALGDQVAVETNLLAFTAAATDADAGQALTFSLDPGAPAGAGITADGAFTWTPPVAASAPQTNTITVRVTDSGSPALSDSKTFNVVVVKPPRLEIELAPDARAAVLSWATFPGVSYDVDFRESVETGPWQTLTNSLPAAGMRTRLTNELGGPSQRFYQVRQLR